MRDYFQGDESFCLVALIASRFITGRGSLLASAGIIVSDGFMSSIRYAVLIALILGLFYGPAPKRINKKLFWIVVIIVSALSILLEVLTKVL